MQNEDQIQRVRRICTALPGTTEKLSHGEPTFFVKKRVCVALSNNHHDDGHIAICIPAEPGEQEALIKSSPKKYYRPPYVGAKGWIGIELPEVDNEELGSHILNAYRLISAKKK